MKRPFLMTALVIALLGICHFLPSHIGGKDFTPINLLSDIFPEEDTLMSDEMLEVLPPFEEDSVPEGMTPILDYGRLDADFGREMALFYEQLANSKQLGRPVRIAVFGDSFIEGDIITDELRRLMQNDFGGHGVGWVDICPLFEGIRATVGHKHSDWRTHSLIKSESGFQEGLIGLGLRYFLPKGNSWLEISGTKYEHLDKFGTFHVYVRPEGTANVQLTLNDGETRTLTTTSRGQMEDLNVSGNLHKVRMTTNGHGIFYGIAAEDNDGIVVDNMSARGTSGHTIAKIPVPYLKQMAHLRPYDLIILQFGLNVTQPNVTKYTSYKEQMARTIEHLKSAYPNAAIMVWSVGDRDGKRPDGTFRTYPGIKAMVHTQQLLASEEKVAFWSIYQSMGGESSMAEWVNHSPMLAAKDYTHISRAGGRIIAKNFYDALVFGYEQYNKKCSWKQGAQHTSNTK